MRPYPFVLHERAREEYIAAYEWYELQQKDLGKRFMNSIEKRLEQISEHPEYYGKRKGNYRCAKAENFPYMIVYEFFKESNLFTLWQSTTANEILELRSAE